MKHILSIFIISILLFPVIISLPANTVSAIDDYGYRYFLCGKISGYSNESDGSIYFVCDNVIGRWMFWISPNTRYGTFFHIKSFPLSFVSGTVFKGIHTNNFICGIFSYQFNQSSVN